MKQWSEWCKNHDSDYIVLKKDNFTFNIHDVCLTPHVMVEWSKKPCRIKITTAQSTNGKWSYGYDYDIYYTGGGAGAFFVKESNKGYPTEKEAVYAALLFLEEKIKRELEIRSESRGDEIEVSNICTGMKSTLKEISSFKELFNPIQLSLFD